MAKNPIPKMLIQPRVWNAGQSWHYQGVWLVCGRKVRIDIRRNAYDMQSHLRAEVFDPVANNWNELCSQPIEVAACKAISYVDKQEKVMLPFRLDAKALLDEAAVILA